ncbi:MAG: CbtA family protein [Bauldia sp.]|nr:CbtA family protein [Bauldia sp.]
MFRTILFSAFGAGLAVCLLVTLVQTVTTEPLILHAEEFEGGGHDHAAAAPHDHDAAAAATDASVVAHDHGDGSEWAPADGAQRIAFTALANLVVGIGASLILLALMVLRGAGIDARRGVLWGGAAFVAVALLPALGLPPELPGTPAADLLDRQLWWLGTALASGAGIALIAFGGHWAVKVAGLVLLVAPHAIGAPQPPSHDVAYPGALAGEFVIASLVVSGVLWTLAGASVGWLYQRLSRTT